MRGITPRERSMRPRAGPGETKGGMCRWEDQEKLQEGVEFGFVVGVDGI